MDSYSLLRNLDGIYGCFGAQLSLGWLITEKERFKVNAVIIEEWTLLCIDSFCKEKKWIDIGKYWWDMIFRYEIK